MPQVTAAATVTLGNPPFAPHHRSARRVSDVPATETTPDGLGQTYASIKGSWRERASLTRCAHLSM